MVLLLQKTVGRVLRKLKIDRPYDPEFPFPRLSPKELISESQRDTCTLLFTATLFTIAKIYKQPKFP